MRHLLFLINPISGTRSKTSLAKQVQAFCEKNELAHSILPTAVNGDYRFAIEHIENNMVTDVVIAGGDGTVNQVVSALRHLRLNFGILPCGSGNGLAYAARIPSDHAAALELLLRGEARAIDGFLLNDHFACMLCGLGFDAKVAHDFARQSKRGLANYVKMVAKNFFSARTWSFELTVKEKTFQTDAYFISIANANQFGNNFTIAPKASLSDGLLDIVILTRQNKVSVLLNTLSQISGKQKLQADTAIDNQKAVVYFQTSALHLKNLAAAPLHIDGDPAETIKELAIQVIPNCFTLFCGK